MWLVQRCIHGKRGEHDLHRARGGSDFEYCDCDGDLGDRQHEDRVGDDYDCAACSSSGYGFDYPSATVIAYSEREDEHHGHREQ